MPPPLTPGPFALPMTDRQAFSLEVRLKKLPKEFEPRRLSLAQSTPEPLPEGRSDLSWITAEAPDRQGDLVLASGMDDAHFKLNPIVTLNHDYQRPPVGRSLWRRPVRAGNLHGIQAKTYYPPRPKEWSEGPWLPDLAWELLRVGLLNAKSIGFLPLKVRPPTREEIRADPAFSRVRAIVEHWLLLEYACCFLPVQPFAVVEIAQLQPQTSLSGKTASLLQKNHSDFYETPSRANNPQPSFLPEILGFLASPAFTHLLCQRLQRSYRTQRAMLR